MIEIQVSSLSLCIISDSKRNYLTVQGSLDHNKFYPSSCMLEVLQHQTSPTTMRDQRFEDIDNKQNGFILQKQGQEVQVFGQRVCEYDQQTNPIHSVDNNNKRIAIYIPYFERQRRKKIQQLSFIQPVAGNIQLFQKIFKQVHKISQEIIVIFNLFKGKSKKGQINYHIRYQQCQLFNKRLQNKQRQQQQIKQVIKVFQAVLVKKIKQIKEFFNKYTQKVVKIIDIPELLSLDEHQMTIGTYLFLFKYLHVTSKSQLKEYQAYVKQNQQANGFFISLIAVIQGNIHKSAHKNFAQDNLYTILKGFRSDYELTVQKYLLLLMLETKITPSHIANNRKFVEQIFYIKDRLPFYHYVNFFSKILIPKQKYQIKDYFCEKKFRYQSISIVQYLLQIRQYFIRDNLDYCPIDQFCSKYIHIIQDMILKFEVTTDRDQNFSRIPGLYGLLVYLRENTGLAQKMKQTIIILQKRLEELYLFVNKVKNDLRGSQLLEFSSFLQAFERSNSTNDLQDQYRRHLYEDQPRSLEMTHY